MSLLIALDVFERMRNQEDWHLGVTEFPLS
jgi:hypothetical protein